MDIKLGNKWHDSHSVGNWEVWNADIRPEDEREAVFLDHDTNFVHRDKETGEMRLPHRFPDFSLGYLPLTGVDLDSDSHGCYWLNEEKLKNSYPDFRIIIYQRPDGKNFDFHEPNEPQHDDSMIRYELKGRDAFDYLDVGTRAEVQLANLAPVDYAELSHASRTSAPQFRWIELPDVMLTGGVPTRYPVNPMEMSLTALMEDADCLQNRNAPNDALHVASILVQMNAIDAECRMRYEDSLELFSSMSDNSNNPMRAASYAVYHCGTDRSFDDSYDSGVKKALKYLARAGSSVDDIQRMINSKDNLFRDDKPLIDHARKFLHSKEFSMYTEMLNQERSAGGFAR